MMGVVRHRNHSYRLENWPRCFLFIRSNPSKPVTAEALCTYLFPSSLWLVVLLITVYGMDA